MLIWIVQYRMKDDEHDHLSVYTDEVKAQQEYIKLKDHRPWHYVTISVYQV